MLFKTYICAILLLLSANVKAFAFLHYSKDTPVLLQTATISTIAYHKLLHLNKTLHTDSLYLNYLQANNLANVLEQQSMAFIKNYGAGQIATISFRGGNASHTPVLWNGFNLQNPMLGQTDFSQIPAFFLNDIQINFGSNAALFGSGHIGGTIQLETTKQLKHGFSGKAMVGSNSMQTHAAGLELNYKKNKFETSQRFWINGGQNRFSYVNESKLNKPVEQANHAAFNTMAWLNQNRFFIKKNQQLLLSSWIQSTRRNIQPALSAANTNAKQLDYALRISGDYIWQNNQYKIQLRSALLNDIIHFESTVNPQSKSNSNVLTNFADVYRYFNHAVLHIGFMQQYEKATADGYNFVSRNRYAIFGSLQWHWLNQRLMQQISGRQEISDNSILPFTPSYSITYAFTKELKVIGNASKTYRLPTFNDLYWRNLGNPTLMPESGYSTELSINYQNKTVVFMLTGYHKNINNWIIWTPNNLGLFKPDNIAKVWSRGIEFNWQLKYAILKNHIIQLNGLHDYNLASNQQAKHANDNSLYKQLIYSPRLKHRFNVTYLYKKFTFNINHTYTGVTFTSADNLNWLPPVNITNINISKNLPLKNRPLLLGFNINNLLNTNYQIMMGRPMPLRNYQINLTLYF